MTALGDRVLDLQPGVHLQEGTGSPSAVDQELDGPGADVADRPRRGDRRVAQPGAQPVRQRPTAPPRRPSGAGAGSSSPARRAPAPCRARRRGPAPRRAGTGSSDALAEHGAVAERGRRLPPRRPRPPRPARDRSADDPHAPPAAAGGGLDQQREASRRPAPRRASSAGSTGTPAAAISALASILDPIASMASGGGPTQVSPASSTARAKAAFSDRKPYPGWTASAPVAPRRGDQQVGRAGRCRPAPRRAAATAASASRTAARRRPASEYTATVRDAQRRGRCGTPGGRSRRGWRPAARLITSAHIRKTP